MRQFIHFIKHEDRVSAAGALDILVEGPRRLKLIAYADTYVTDASHQVTGINLEQQLCNDMRGYL